MNNTKLEKLKTLEQHKYDPNCEYCTNNVFVKDAIKTKEDLEKDKSNALIVFQKYNELKNKINGYGNIESEYKKYQDNNINKTNLENKLNKLSNSIVSTENKISQEETKLNTIIETYDNLIETFEGIRKDNSRLIFIILITIIIGDCLMDCFV